MDNYTGMLCHAQVLLVNGSIVTRFTDPSCQHNAARLCSGSGCARSETPNTTLSTSTSLSGYTTSRDFADVLEKVCEADPTNKHQFISNVISIPLCFIILATNIIVLLLIGYTNKLHTPTYVFVASLACADILVGLDCVATVITEATEGTLELCLVRIGFIVSGLVCSLYSLMAIAIERYIAIVIPLTYDRAMTKIRVAVTIFVTWLISFGIGFLPLFGWNPHIYKHYCSFLFVESPFYVGFLFSVGGLLPVAVIVCVYIKLYHKAKSHIKRIDAIETLSPHSKLPGGVLGMSPRNWRSLKTLIIVLGCIILTWSPFLIATFVQILFKVESCLLKNVAGTYLLLIGFSNSFLNPLVYTFRTRDFREKVTKHLSANHRFCQRRLSKMNIVEV